MLCGEKWEREGEGENVVLSLTGSQWQQSPPHLPLSVAQFFQIVLIISVSQTRAVEPGYAAHTHTR